MVTPRCGNDRMSARTSRSPVTATDRPVSAAVSRTTVWLGSSPWSTAPPGSDQTPGVPERLDARTSSTRPPSSVATAYAAIRRSGSSAGVTGGNSARVLLPAENVCRIPDRGMAVRNRRLWRCCLLLAADPLPSVMGFSGSFSGLSPRSCGPGSGQHGGMTDAPYRRLLRPQDDRIVAGVCSGIGRYFGVDPVLIRVAFAIFAVVTWGVALIAYPACWFLIPEEP